MTGFDDRRPPALRAEGAFGGEPGLQAGLDRPAPTALQDLVPDEAGIEDPVVFAEGPGTSSRLHPLRRPKFGELLAYAWPGDTVHISEMFRLVRATDHILDVLDVLHADRLVMCIHEGAFTAMDLSARHPRTGELLSTVKFIVQTLAAAGELLRDLRREMTYDGLRAAEAKGNRGGRRPAVPAGRSKPCAPRTWRANPSPLPTSSLGTRPPIPAPQPHCRSSLAGMPGKVADFLPPQKPTWSPPSAPRSTKA